MIHDKPVQIGSTSIRIIQGDITESDVDAIVNPANSRLQHGGGVAGAIVRKGGQMIQDESNRIGHVPVGQAVLTKAGELKARYVIHTVGPRWGEGNEDQKLRDAVRNTLKLATVNHFTSLAMPAISGGIFGFPKDRCARIIVDETVLFLRSVPTSLTEVCFVLMDTDIIGHFRTALSAVGEKP